jgi:hypothetical protein
MDVLDGNREREYEQECMGSKRRVGELGRHQTWQTKSQEKARSNILISIKIQDYPR